MFVMFGISCNKTNDISGIQFGHPIKLTTDMFKCDRIHGVLKPNLNGRDIIYFSYDLTDDLLPIHDSIIQAFKQGYPVDLYFNQIRFSNWLSSSDDPEFIISKCIIRRI